MIRGFYFKWAFYGKGKTSLQPFPLGTVFPLPLSDELLF